MTFKVLEQGKYLPTWKFLIPVSEHLQSCQANPTERVPCLLLTCHLLLFVLDVI